MAFKIMKIHDDGTLTVLNNNLFKINEKMKTFESVENNLLLDFENENGWKFITKDNCGFHTKDNCEFHTKDNCIFRTGSNCEFTTGSNCEFITSDKCTFTTYFNCKFKTGNKCKFTTKNICKFKTGNKCKFKTGDCCEFESGDISKFAIGLNCKLYDIGSFSKITLNDGVYEEYEDNEKIRDIIEIIHIGDNCIFDFNPGYTFPIEKNISCPTIVK